jgi:GTP cyclohydrolase FolE2
MTYKCPHCQKDIEICVRAEYRLEKIEKENETSYQRAMRLTKDLEEKAKRQAGKHGISQEKLVYADCPCTKRLQRGSTFRRDKYGKLHDSDCKQGEWGE